VRRYLLRLPSREPLKITDTTRGELPVSAEEVEGMVLADAERRPTPQLKDAASTLALGLTDVILGHDEPAEAARLTALCRLLDKPAPRFLHLPPLAQSAPNPALAELRAEGYLGSAVANALVLLGWTPPEEAYALSWDLIVLLYEPDRVVGPTVLFDPARLRSLNQAHLRALSFEELGEALSPFLREARMLSSERSPERWARLAREEIFTLAEVRQLAYLVDEGLAGPKSAPEEALRLLGDPTVEPLLAAAEEVLAAGESDFHTLRAAIEARTGAKRKQLFFPLRAALTGRLHGPPLPEILPFLGAEESCRRIAAWRAWKRATKAG
jgi:nondiscriminating glutamyl-tRNA synthetase